VPSDLVAPRRRTVRTRGGVSGGPLILGAHPIGDVHDGRGEVRILWLVGSRMIWWVASTHTTVSSNPAWRYVGRDERERELEIVAVELDDTPAGDAVLLVIHVMPTHLRRREQT